MCVAAQYIPAAPTAEKKGFRSHAEISSVAYMYEIDVGHVPEKNGMAWWTKPQDDWPGREKKKAICAEEARPGKTELEALVDLAKTENVKMSPALIRFEVFFTHRIIVFWVMTLTLALRHG